MRDAAIVFVGALALRTLYVLSIRSAYFFDHLQTEPLRYQRWAALILSGRWPRPPFDEAPGYPFFLAASAALVGGSIQSVAIIQCVLGACTCVAIAAIARRCFGVRAGLIAGVIAAMYGPLIYFSAELLPVALFLCVSTAAVAVALFPASAQSTPPAGQWRWTLSGSLWGLALLVRSETVLALPWVALDAWQRGGRRGVYRALTPVLVVLTLMLGVNLGIGRKFVVLTTGSGLNLWLGNNPDSDGVSPFLSGPVAQVAEATRVQAADAAAWDRLLREYAAAFWRDTPLQGLRLVGKKFLWTWVNRELPNTSDVDWQTAHSWLFCWPPFLPIGFGVLLPLAAAGAASVGRRWRGRLLLAALPSIALGTCLIFFTNARFRIVMVPTLIVLAAVAIDSLLAARRGRHHDWRGRAAAGAFVIGALAAWGNVSGVRQYRIPEILVNTGVLEREAGHFDSAVRWLRQGLALRPQDAIAWTHLALALEQQGQLEAALQAYADGLSAVPDDPDLRQMSERFLQRQHWTRARLEARMQHH